MTSLGLQTYSYLEASLEASHLKKDSTESQILIIYSSKEIKCDKEDSYSIFK